MQEPRPAVAEPETKTMQAIIQESYGKRPRDVFEIADIPIPEPAADQVLIRVAASTVNALDWHYMTGTPYFMRLEAGLRTPKRTIPGADVSGTVVRVGSEVTGLEPGDEVFGGIGSGGFAEYAVGKASRLAHRPTSIPLEEAATLGVAAITALQGLRDWGAMKAGDRVLINGASGGVGTFAVQIAKALGASHVTAVVSTHNVDIARSLGADRVIDYTKEDFAAVDDRFDVFFDNAGSKSLGRSRRLLTDQGTLVMISGKKGTWFRPIDRALGGLIRSRFWSQRFVTKVADDNGDDGRVLAQLVDDGKLRPVIDRRFTLGEGIEALEYQAAGHARGKSIIEVS